MDPHHPRHRRQGSSRTGFHIAAVAFSLIAILLGGVLLVGLLLPGVWEAHAEIRIEAAPEEVFVHLTDAEGWARWTPMPESGVEVLEANEEAQAGGWMWDDPRYGSGRFYLMEIDSPRQLRYVVEVEGGSLRTDGTLILEAVDGATEIRWMEEGDFGWNPILGYLAARMGRAQTEQMEGSLDRLRGVVEDRVAEDARGPLPSRARASPDSSG